ncbi:MAG: hypothetical protein HYY01_03205 [Chloroflexi bacterium]|nr:hypothetical protein [Chloroflexota bacterium]
MRSTSLVTRLAIGLSVFALAYSSVLVLGSQVARAYKVTIKDGNEIKWNKLQIKWNGDFQDGQSYLGVFPPETRQDLRNSAMQWDDITTGASLNVDEVASGHDVWWSGIPFGQRGLNPHIPGTTVLNWDASTGYLNWGVSYLNSEWTWRRDCYLNQFNHQADARVMATHEDGHWLSLDDFPDGHPEAVMWPNYTCKLYTVTDDHNGAKYLYP